MCLGMMSMDWPDIIELMVEWLESRKRWSKLRSAWVLNAGAVTLRP